MVDLLLFIPACFALNLAFGPNNLLSVSFGAERGVKFAAIAGTGRLLIFVPMIVGSALGLGALLSVSVAAFNVLKIAGAVYLVYLGMKMLLSSAGGDTAKENVPVLPLRKAMRSEMLIALGNPKAILIFAAFFPQFIDLHDYWASYGILAAIFLALESIAIVVYALIGKLAHAFAAKKLHWLQRSSGVGMIVFGFLLLFAKQPARA